MSSQDHWSDWTEEGRPFIETGEVRTKPESESPKEDRKMTKEELDEFEINETGLSSDSEDEKAVDGKVYYPNDGSRPFIVKNRPLFGIISPNSDAKKSRKHAKAAALAKQVMQRCEEREKQAALVKDNVFITPRQCKYCKCSPCFMDYHYEDMMILGTELEGHDVDNKSIRYALYREMADGW
jgi:hypothetical protein